MALLSSQYKRITAARAAQQSAATPQPASEPPPAPVATPVDSAPGPVPEEQNIAVSADNAVTGAPTSDAE
jgi:hypothetical protein